MPSFYLDDQDVIPAANWIIRALSRELYGERLVSDVACLVVSSIEKYKVNGKARGVRSAINSALSLYPKHAEGLENFIRKRSYDRYMGTIKLEKTCIERFNLMKSEGENSTDTLLRIMNFYDKNKF